MSRYRGRRKQRMSDMNVVPYIDVMLVLLIIFMITSPLLTESVKVNLPKATTGEGGDSPPSQMIIVTVEASGAVLLESSNETGEIISIEPQALAVRIAAMNRLAPDLRVFVRGDINAPYGKVLEAFDLLRAAGIQRVSLVTEQR